MNTSWKNVFRVGCLALLATVSSVHAHGEWALEPFIRMRTIQWYDITWSTSDVKVNDEVIISGKFHVAEDWPAAVPPPESAYLNVASPGPVFVRKATFINGVSTVNAVKLQLGGDYQFSIRLKGRIPGQYHIHPMMNLKDTGVIVGPGQWITVAGAAGEFTNPVTTVEGETIDLESYGTGNAIFWHALWAFIAVVWTLWWVSRPLFITRNRLLKANQEKALVTTADRNMARAILLGTLLLVAGAYAATEAKYPNTIPLQAGRVDIEPLPEPAQQVVVKVKRANYVVADRVLAMTLEITNNTAESVQLGEFNTATLRFINPKGGKADPNYPKEITAESGLTVDLIAPIQSGETRVLQVRAKDAAWRTERLDSLTKDADSRFGGLAFFYSSNGGRYMTSISGPVVPVY